jgi:protocatechuate 3,4-dioxygenase beta subunit
MGQGTTDVINKLDLKLKSAKTTVSKVLGNDSLMYLHSLAPFREIIKENAKAEHITIISDSEPGTQITIKGLVTDEKGNPSRNLIVYFYQTSDKGWYSDTAAHILAYEGDFRHARLFGYLKTDNNGVFSFTTIKPKGYPKSDLAAHIHIHFWDAASNPLRGPGELQFDDDPRMTPERRRESLASGYLISKNSGTEKLPVYEYKIVLKDD